MSDYEHIVVSAVRYALGRMTYIVGITVDYVMKEITDNKLSKKCLWVIRSDIEHQKNLGMECDAKQWEKLKNKIGEVI